MLHPWSQVVIDHKSQAIAFAVKLYDCTFVECSILQKFSLHKTKYYA